MSATLLASLRLRPAGSTSGKFQGSPGLSQALAAGWPVIFPPPLLLNYFPSGNGFQTLPRKGLVVQKTFCSIENKTKIKPPAKR